MQACSSSTRPDFDADDDASASAEAGIVPQTDSGSGITSDGSNGGPRTGPAEVFVHSSDTLYKLDPNSSALELSRVGKFTGVDGSMVDIALNEEGAMYGTTYNAVYRIDKETGAATLIRTQGTPADKTYPDSLSFVPKGTLAEDREVLVGYRGSDYISIDPDTGAIEVIEANALGDELVSSGDIVSIKEGNFLTYLTVKPNPEGECQSSECRACENNDCLFEVDPVTGAKISNLGSSKRKNVFGLAFWAGTVYGINSEGNLFKLETDDPVRTTNITIPSGLGTIRFFGAGSSTSAPDGPN